MNQDQRKYLISEVSKTLSEQTQELERKKPKHPSLNNYLIAAFLDNTIEFADLSPLKEKIKSRVIRMGKEDVLIEENDGDDWYSGRRTKKSDKSHYVKLLAQEIFVIPAAYTEALKEYQQKTGEIEEKIKQLTAQAKTITMKIQIGSAASLNKLVTEVDNLVDLNLVNSKFLLGNGE